jgi:hypothetical protein
LVREARTPFGTDPPWPVAGPAGPEAGNPDAAQGDLEPRGVTPLPGRDDDRHGFLPLLDGRVQLGGQAAARASESVVGRFDGDAAGRLLTAHCSSVRSPRATNQDHLMLKIRLRHTP